MFILFLLLWVAAGIAGLYFLTKGIIDLIKKRSGKENLKKGGIAVLASLAFLIVAVLATPAEEAEVTQNSEAETELAESKKSEETETELEVEEIVDKPEETEEVNEPEVETKEESSEVKEKPEPISSEDEGILPPEFALSLMESNFEGMANVTYSSEDKAFLIEPTDQEIQTALILLLEGSTPEINASWEFLKDSFVSTSNSLKDSVGAGYQIHLLNPMNNENTLLIIIDGVVIYDAFSQ